MKLPPTRTCSSWPIISFFGRQSHAAGALEGECCTASSIHGAEPETSSDRDPGAFSCRCGLRLAFHGGEVIVKPPARETPGMWTSSHWPGRNEKEL